MIHPAATDFLIAVQADARYEAQLLEWEAARRVFERVEKKEQADKDIRRESQDLLTVALVAGVSPAEKRKLEERLDEHQEALIRALQENREALDASQERLEALLEDAYITEDGRRVFKTRDGERVFDERGNEVGAGVVDKDSIEDWRPRYEDFATQRQYHNELRQTHQALETYQSRLDGAQDRMSQGSLSEAEYDELDALLGDPPEALKPHLSGYDDVPGQTTAYLDTNAPSIGSDLSIGAKLFQ